MSQSDVVTDEKLLVLTITVYQHSQSLRFFVNVNQFFKNVQFSLLCRDSLSFMQYVEGLLETLKNRLLVFSCV